jgi:hypothetical protein
MDVMAKVRGLVALATGLTTPGHEASAAALAAVRLIKKHELLGPGSGSGAGSGSGSGRRRAASGWESPVAGQSGRARGPAVASGSVVYLVLTDTLSLYRLGEIHLPSQQTSRIFTVDKASVGGVVFMTQEETAAIGWGSSRIIRTFGKK